MEVNSEASNCNCNLEKTMSENKFKWKLYLPILLSLTLLFIGMVLDYMHSMLFLNEYIRLGWYVLAYIPVAFSVIKEAIEGFFKKEFFTEFTLMSVATLGAFFVGEYPEAVAVMVFYSIGELFQDSAVEKVKRNIKALLDVRPTSATVLKKGVLKTTSPEEVKIGDVIQVKAGEKVSLDGVLLSYESSFNTSALTGESKPKTIREGEKVLAGMLNLDKVVEIQVEKEFSDSSLAKILEMVQDATSRKAKTELLIRRFAKIYTPLVFLLAVAITIIPFFFVQEYVFNQWLYKALIFLVISCPCALVISVPLGYFAGIGMASRNGILFKGANYLDLMARVNTVIMDKTGTLTKGVFKVQEIHSQTYNSQTLVNIAGALESYSNHPIAKAIVEYMGENNNYAVTEVEELSGYGLKGIVNGDIVLAGNSKLMKKYNITYDKLIDDIIETIVLVAINNSFAGYITIADELKEDAISAIEKMHKQAIKTIVLSGDKTSITTKVAQKLGIITAYGDLLPQDKLTHIEQVKSDKLNIVAFVGDGINDTPALALSDVGIAMGGMGSDAAIEVADVVIQTDQPSKISTAIKIAKTTKKIVIQNIVLALSVKIVILLLGVIGVATMWEAVFADVGVSLLAILNSVRILYKKVD